MSDDVAEEGHKFGTGVALGRASQDLAAACLQRGKERKSSVTIILKAMALGAARGKRQDRIEAIERLDGAFLIDAEDGGMGRGMEVKTNNIQRLGFKLGISTGHVTA